jgi:putative DNA primase/helicase
MIALSDLARALGGEVVGGQVLCPGPGHSPRDRSLSVRVSEAAHDGVVVYSHAGNDWRDCLDHVRDRLGLDHDIWKSRRRTRRSRVPASKGPSAHQDNRNLELARQIVREVKPIVGTPGERYLAETRNIDTRPLAGVLERIDAIGWHDAVYLNEPGHALHGQRLGCIIGIMSDPVTALPTGAISRTYIGDGLRKIGKAKTLGSPAGVVRISPDEDVLSGLHLAEGLETVLSAMSIGLRPIWATGSTSLLKRFPVLGGVEALSILADHDVSGAGEKAARKLELRYRGAGREVRIFRSDKIGDLNDVLRANDR